MIAEFGNITLVLSFFISALILITRVNPAKLYSAILAANFISFSSLVYCFIISDFSVYAVYQYSHTLKPLVYRISGAWGNHEGSILLIVLILSAYNFAFFNFSKLNNSGYYRTIAKSQAFINLGFIGFILFTSNPFMRNIPVPANGLGLNPLLQDIGLAMHPPVLYMGYIGFSITFSIALSALMAGGYDRTLINMLRKYTLFSWSFLTIGIGLGSWWAYRELGWGGFWFWDPVENVSLLPWLAATAFLHSILVMEKRQGLIAWTSFLGLLTFSLSLIGIFLVRSGILTSVHSFANDPTRGIFILIFLSTVVAYSLIVFAMKAHRLSSNPVNIKSREGLLLFNNLVLTVLCFTVLLGTLYPMVIEILSEHSITVGAPYFNNTFCPIAIILLILAAIAPSLSWKQADDSNLQLYKYLAPFLSAVVAVIYIAVMDKPSDLIHYPAIFAAIFLITYTAQLFIQRYLSVEKIPLRFSAMVISHIGIGLLALSVSIATGWNKEDELAMKKGDVIDFASYNITLKDVQINAGKNYISRIGVFNIWQQKNELATLMPEQRFYPVEQSTTTESAIYYSLFSNLYLAIGESSGDNYAVRLYYKPCINLIWVSCLLIALGGFLAITEKRVRS